MAKVKVEIIEAFDNIEKGDILHLPFNNAKELVADGFAKFPKEKTTKEITKTK